METVATCRSNETYNWNNWVTNRRTPERWKTPAFQQNHDSEISWMNDMCLDVPWLHLKHVLELVTQLWEPYLERIYRTVTTRPAKRMICYGFEFPFRLFLYRKTLHQPIRPLLLRPLQVDCSAFVRLYPEVWSWFKALTRTSYPLRPILLPRNTFMKTVHVLVWWISTSMSRRRSSVS